MDELDPESRLLDLEDTIAFRNHKGATKNEDLLKNLVEKCDVLIRYSSATIQDEAYPRSSDGTYEHHEPEYYQ